MIHRGGGGAGWGSVFGERRPLVRGLACALLAWSALACGGKEDSTPSVESTRSAAQFVTGTWQVTFTEPGAGVGQRHGTMTLQAGADPSAKVRPACGRVDITPSSGSPWAPGASDVRLACSNDYGMAVHGTLTTDDGAYRDVGVRGTALFWWNFAGGELDLLTADGGSLEADFMRTSGFAEGTFRTPSAADGGAAATLAVHLARP